MDFEVLNSAQNSTPIPPMPDTGTMENSGVEEYKTSLISVLSRMQELFDRIEHPELASVYGDIIYMIENFDA
jgi:hypothetical protein